MKYSDMDDKTQHGPFTLIQTCQACPEQYDVYLINDEKLENEVAYMRLRHGYFRVSDPSQHITYYEAHPEGDGVFDTEQERWEHINNALIKVWESLTFTSLTEGEWERIMEDPEWFLEQQDYNF